MKQNPRREKEKWGLLAKILGREGAENGREFLCGSAASAATVWVRDVGYDPTVGEIP